MKINKKFVATGIIVISSFSVLSIYALDKVDKFIQKKNFEEQKITKPLKYLIADQFYNSSRDLGLSNILNFDPIYDVNDIQKEFELNESAANLKYLNKNIFLSVFIESVIDQNNAKTPNESMIVSDTLNKNNIILNCKVDGYENKELKYSNCDLGFTKLPYDSMFKSLESKVKEKNRQAMTLYLMNYKVENSKSKDCKDIPDLNEWGSLDNIYPKINLCLVSAISGITQQEVHDLVE